MQAAGSTLLINLPKLSARPAEIGALQKNRAANNAASAPNKIVTSIINDRPLLHFI